MGVYRFERSTGEIGASPNGRTAKVLSFDSHPKTSLCAQFGWDPGKYKIKEIAIRGSREIYDVFAGNYDTEGSPKTKPFRVGILTYTDPMPERNSARGG